MKLSDFSALFQAFFSRLVGSKGTTVQIGAGTTTGSFNTIYIGETATISAIVGGGTGATTWVGEIPAGVTLTTVAGYPITSITITTGTIVCYP